MNKKKIEKNFQVYEIEILHVMILLKLVLNRAELLIDI